MLKSEDATVSRDDAPLQIRLRTRSKRFASLQLRYAKVPAQGHTGLGAHWTRGTVPGYRLFLGLAPQAVVSAAQSDIAARAAPLRRRRCVLFDSREGNQSRNILHFAPLHWVHCKSSCSMPPTLSAYR